MAYVCKEAQFCLIDCFQLLFFNLFFPDRLVELSSLFNSFVENIYLPVGGIN